MVEYNINEQIHQVGREFQRRLKRSTLPSRTIFTSVLAMTDRIPLCLNGAC